MRFAYSADLIGLCESSETKLCPGLTAPAPRISLESKSQLIWVSFSKPAGCVKIAETYVWISRRPPEAKYMNTIIQEALGAKNMDSDSFFEPQTSAHTIYSLLGTRCIHYPRSSWAVPYCYPYTTNKRSHSTKTRSGHNFTHIHCNIGLVTTSCLHCRMYKLARSLLHSHFLPTLDSLCCLKLWPRRRLEHWISTNLDFSLTILRRFCSIKYQDIIHIPHFWSNSLQSKGCNQLAC